MKLNLKTIFGLFPVVLWPKTTLILKYQHGRLISTPARTLFLRGFQDFYLLQNKMRLTCAIISFMNAMGQGALWLLFTSPPLISNPLYESKRSRPGGCQPKCHQLRWQCGKTVITELKGSTPLPRLNLSIKQHKINMRSTELQHAKSILKSVNWLTLDRSTL